MKEVAFAHKQRAIRQALQMGEQIARRRARATLAAALTAWRVQVGGAEAGGRRELVGGGGVGLLALGFERQWQALQMGGHIARCRWRATLAAAEGAGAQRWVGAEAGVGAGRGGARLQGVGTQVDVTAGSVQVGCMGQGRRLGFDEVDLRGV